jgi:hypothetical protein
MSELVLVACAVAILAVTGTIIGGLFIAWWQISIALYTWIAKRIEVSE